MDKSKQPGIRFLSIFLMKEKFWRADQHIDTNRNCLDFESKISALSAGVHINEVRTTLTCQDENKNTLLELDFTYVGAFEADENSNMDIRSFMEKNSSAHIFPYIREHIAHTTMKSGVQPIYIPPINIIAFLQDKKSTS